MANIVIKDGAGNTKYVKAAGAGSDGDPFIPDQTISLPTGASTAANQTTIIGHLDGVEGLLTTIDADTGSIATAAAAIQAAAEAIQTAVETLDNIVAGNEAQVDVLTLPNVTVGAALPAGTNAIGKLAANSGVDIGDVDVTSLPDVEIAEKTITTQATTEADSGDNTLVAGPGAGTRIVVSSIVVQNESATATTILLKSGANTKRRALLQNQGDGVAWSFPPGREWKLGDNEALIVNLSGANSHGVTVDYYTEAV